MMDRETAELWKKELIIWSWKYGSYNDAIMAVIQRVLEEPELWKSRLGPVLTSPMQDMALVKGQE